MKIINQLELEKIAGGANNPGHDDLGIAVKEGALTALLCIPPTLLIFYGVGATSRELALVAGAVFHLAMLSEMALAYYDVPATYIFYPNNTANSAQK